MLQLRAKAFSLLLLRLLGLFDILKSIANFQSRLVKLSFFLSSLFVRSLQP